MAEVTCVWCERPGRWVLVPEQTVCCSRHAVWVLCLDSDTGVTIVPAPVTGGSLAP